MKSKHGPEPFPGNGESGGHGEVTGCWALESEGRVVFRGMELFSAAASLAVSDVCEVYAFSSVECVMSRKNQCASVNPQMRKIDALTALNLVAGIISERS